MIKEGITVSDALDIIRRDGVGERIIYFYIVNDEGKLVGIIPTRRLLTVAPNKTIADIMINDVVKISSRATVQEACELFVKHKFFALPIVDDRDYMCGVIDIGFFSQDTVSVGEREKIEDIFELIGFGMSQLRGRSALGVLRYRLPWLIVMVVSGLICALLVNAYLGFLVQNVFIISFLLLVLGLSESVSSQSLTLALQRLHFGPPAWMSYLGWLKSELLASLLLGIVCGGLAGGLAWLWQGTQVLGVTVGLSVLSAIMIAAFIGVTIPTLLHATHEQSKIAAGPVTHALTFVTSLLIYLGAARFLLG